MSMKFRSSRADRTLGRLILFGALLAAAACSGPDERAEGDAAILEDALEWVGRIPDGEVPSDYILANPRMSVALEPGGDLLILDEDWIKVYDSDGRPRTRFGGPGDGPGELRMARSLFQSPSGYLTAFGGMFGFTGHVFRPDRSYVASRDFMSRPPVFPQLEKRNLRTGRPWDIYAIDDHRWVYAIEASDRDRNLREHLELFLLLDAPDSVTVVADYPRTDMVVGERISYGMPSLGWLYFALLPDDRVAWCHTFHDVDFDSEPATYSIRIMDLRSGARSVIRHPFERTPLVWTPRASESLRERNPEQYSWMVALDRKAEQRYIDQKFEAPIRGLVSDGRFLFVMTCVTKDTTYTLVDVFDTSDGEYLSSVWLQGALLIRDGFLYQTNNYRVSGEEPMVNRYRLRPEVYGRRR